MNKLSKTLIIATAWLIGFSPLSRAMTANAAADGDKYTVKVELDSRLFRFSSDSLQLKISTADGIKSIQTQPTTRNDSVITATFEGNIDGNAIAYMTFAGEDHFSVPFILEAGETEIYSQNMGKFCTLSAKGTPLNNSYNEYNKETQQAGKPFDDRIEALKADKTLTQVQRGQQYAGILAEKSAAQEKISEKYIAANCDNALAAMLYVGNFEIKNNNLELAEKYWKLLSPKIQKIKEVADRHARAVAFNTVKEGEMFRDFTLKHGTTDGKEAKLSDYVGKGKYVLVDFWASWCGACRYGIPNVKAAYEACKGDNFDCLSITVWDKREKSLRAIEEESMPWTQLIDEEGLSSRTYGISAIPRVMLFSPEGRILKIDITRDDIVPFVTKTVKGDKADR